MNKGVRNLLYYLDIVIFASESLEEASTNKQILVDIFSHLGVPSYVNDFLLVASCMLYRVDYACGNVSAACADHELAGIHANPACV